MNPFSVQTPDGPIPGGNWFAMVPKRIWMNPKMSLESKAVWLCLCLHADVTTGESFPSIAHMAVSLGIGRDRVRRAIKDLQAAGLVESRQSRGPGGRTSFYRHKVKMMQSAGTTHLPPAPELPAPVFPATVVQTRTITSRKQEPVKKNGGSSGDERAAFSQTPNPQSPISFEGKTLSPEEILSRCAAQNVDESLAEVWADEVRETGKLDGRIPTQAFLDGRINVIEQSRLGW